MKKTLWIGKEEEGMFKGIDTLFVGSTKISFKTILEAYANYPFEQIYFGAGICTPINQKVVEECLQKLAEVFITIEVSIQDLHKINNRLLNDSNVYYIITNTHKNFSLLYNMEVGRTQIKIQSLVGKKILGIHSGAMFNYIDVKKLNGKTYKDDKVLQ